MMVCEKVTDPGILSEFARAIRRMVITSLAEAGSGHLGGSLGLADVFTVLYHSILKHDPDHPLLPDRDRLILSIGHVAPVLYATLAHSGYFPVEELMTLRKLGSRLQGHPARDHSLPGIELSAGSLGQGLSVAVGMALAARMDSKNHRIYSIHGDGELQEGSIWESAMSAAHYDLSNLTAIVDRNGMQIDGPTENVMRLEPLEEKWKSFGWEVFICDGNSIPDLLNTFQLVSMVRSKPSVIIAKTLMGKGVPGIEGNYRWHGKVPAIDQVEEFLAELDKSGGALR